MLRVYGTCSSPAVHLIYVETEKAASPPVARVAKGGAAAGGRRGLPGGQENQAAGSSKGLTLERSESVGQFRKDYGSLP